MLENSISDLDVKLSLSGTHTNKELSIETYKEYENTKRLLSTIIGEWEIAYNALEEIKSINIL